MLVLTAALFAKQWAQLTYPSTDEQNVVHTVQRYSVSQGHSDTRWTLKALLSETSQKKGKECMRPLT